ncbi:MAG: DUF1761 domain-containing protein [Kiloniellales bacterium]|nr:DUF1761 domain-containing protein [Kiloniellales bacterium]
MVFAGMNYLAILVAAVASFAFGAVYYTVLGKAWMAALGKTEAEVREGATSALSFVIAAVAQLVMAWVLAGTLGHLGEGQVTMRNGVITAGFVWVGFVLTTMAVNHTFQGARRMLTVIDGGFWLGVLLIQGVIIGQFGV